MWDRALRLGLLLLVAAAAGTAWAAEPAPASAPAGSFRPDMLAPHQLFSPNRPILVRFILQNTSEVPVDIPVTTTADLDGAIALPLELVFGPADDPALSIAYRDEKPVRVAPPAPESSQVVTTHDGTLRLAPGAFIGTELDLRDYYPGLRYSGNYHLEWRPVGGSGGAATLDFMVESRKEAIIVTDKGKLTFTLAYDKAPRNVENFLDLVRQGFYDGKPIHRIVPNFLIQAGCPKGDGTGIRPDGRFVPAEFNDLPIQAGTLAMAHKPSDPNSASCQFFVALARLPELDGKYTVIGQASDEESLHTLNTIALEPTDRNDRPRMPLVIRSINLVDAEENRVTRFDLKPARHQSSLPSPPSATQAASAKP
jgi:peptidyl-prolyl cis-trans isomerase B (cyclophilin B)